LKILIILFTALPTLLFSQKENNPYQGKWIRVNPDTVILQVIEYSVDSFEFNLTSNNHDYYGYLGGGEYSNSKHANFQGSHAYFNDSKAISDNQPLYYYGENPCELTFELFDSTRIIIEEKNCSGIYGGAGTTWGGDYIDINSLIKH